MKITRVLIIILAFLILIPITGFLFWSLQKGQVMDLMVVNKTVTSKSNNEMRSLNWVLNYQKIIKPSNQNYNFQQDYFGFHPDPVYKDNHIKAFKLNQIESFSYQYDGLIYLDNEGMQSKDMPDLNYGGFNQSDYLLFKAMSAAGKLLVAEYNFFSDPTEDLVRFNTEQFIDVYSLRWHGKYFKDLSEKKISEDLGKNWLDIYKQNYSQEWNFEGPGIILLNKKQSRILVLPAEEFMNAKYPTIETNKDLAEYYNVAPSLSYTGWFQMVYEGKNKVVSQFNLNLNTEGKNLLKSCGITCVFPATISLAKPHQFFLAGDFSKESGFLQCSKIKYVNDLVGLVCGKIGGTKEKFFHNYYFPFMSFVLDDYIIYSHTLVEN